MNNTQLELPEVIVVMVTVPDRQTAQQLASSLLRERLAACINILGPIESLYIWEGKEEQAAELLLIIKSTASHLDGLKRAVVTLHPYSVPEFLVLPAVDGLSSYLSWVRETTRHPSIIPQ